MQNLKCPVCKSDSYLNPNIKIYISPCFHKLCEQCLYKLFAHGYAPCPECNTQLRRINFITSTFEDIEIEREIKIRKMAHRHFTRASCDFENEEEYNDYLEAFEDLIVDLMDLRTEVAIKDKMNALRSSDCILNPVAVEKIVQDDIVPSKKIKTEEKIWGIYSESVPEKIKFAEGFIIPPELMYPKEASGLTKEDIIGYFLFSLKTDFVF